MDRSMIQRLAVQPDETLAAQSRPFPSRPFLMDGEFAQYYYGLQLQTALQAGEQLAAWFPNYPIAVTDGYSGGRVKRLVAVEKGADGHLMPSYPPRGDHEGPTRWSEYELVPQEVYGDHRLWSPYRPVCLLMYSPRYGSCAQEEGPFVDCPWRPEAANGGLQPQSNAAGQSQSQSAGLGEKRGEAAGRSESSQEGSDRALAAESETPSPQSSSTGKTTPQVMAEPMASVNRVVTGTADPDGSYASPFDLSSADFLTMEDLEHQMEGHVWV